MESSPIGRKAITWVLGIAVVFLGIFLISQGNRNVGDVSAAGNPSVGTGAVQVFLFEDYECSHCADYSTGASFQHLLDTWVAPGHVTVVFKHVAFVHSPYSDAAARAGRCVYDLAPDAWLEWDHMIYQRNLETGGAFNPDEETLFGLADSWGKVDLDAYATCMQDDDALDAVTARNWQEFKDNGLTGTPGMVIGDRIVDPNDLDAVDAAVQAAMGA